MAEVDHEFASKGIANAGLTTGIIGTALGALNGGLLNGLTKTVIPIDSICPAPMPQFNSWTAPTTTATTGA